MAYKTKKAKIFSVTAHSINRLTREPIGKQRTEKINASTNQLFKGVSSNKDVEKRYESFWNDLNPNSFEVVKVVGVKRVQ